MIAIYARQSVDKKDSISIESQIERCKKELLPNEEYKIYQDKGFSGKNIDRPAFSNLLHAIEDGKISKIIVYRLDRISRSITDFANIIDLLEAHRVDFVSTSEKFDTSTPVGRAMLYIIMVFAQLERETIAERIRDNYYSRGKTGVWLGGPAPFGFHNGKIKARNKLVPTIEPNEDLNTVKDIFTLYAVPGASLGSVAKTIRNQRGGVWNNIKVARILHNPAYVKANADIYNYYSSKKCMIVNPIDEFTGKKGCNLYGKRDRAANKYRLTPDHILSLALHEGVIDSGLWLRCQQKLESNRQIKNSGKGKHTWLTGLVKCGYCGYGMGVKINRDVKYFYCTGRYTTDGCLRDKLSTHYVAEIEDAVTREMHEHIAELQSVKIVPLSGTQIETETNRKKQQLVKVEQQIERLLENMANGNSVLIEYINKKIVELDEEKASILDDLNRNAAFSQEVEIPEISNWDTLDLIIKRNIARKMIERVLIYNDKIEVVWRY